MFSVNRGGRAAWVSCLGCAGLLGLGGGRGVAEGVLEHVPSGAMGAVVWEGMSDESPAYAGSKFKAVLEATDMRGRIDRAVQAMLDGSNPNDREAQEAAAFWREAVPVLWRRPWAFYFEGLAWPDQTGRPAGSTPLPRMGFVIEPGEDRAAADQWLNWVFDAINKEEPKLEPTLINDGPLMGLVFRSAVAETTATSLRGSQRYADVVARSVADPEAVLYVDIPAVLDLIRNVVASEGGEQDLAEFERVLQGLGLDNLEPSLWAGGFNQSDWEQAVVIGAPAPRSGLLSLLDREAVTQEQLRPVPRTATWLRATRLDLGEVWDVVVDITHEIDEDGDINITKGIDELNATLGFDLRADLIGAFGDAWTVYADPSFGGVYGSGVALVQEVRQPETLAASLAALEAMLNDTLQQQGVPFQFSKAQSDALELHSLMLPFVAPSWAVSDGRLYMGLTSQAVTSARHFAEHTDNTILDLPELAASRGRLPEGGEVSSLMFTDVSRSADALHQGWSLLLGLADTQGADVPFKASSLLPPMATIKPHLGLAVGGGRADASGYVSRSITPFPGSCLLSQEVLFGNNSMLMMNLGPLVAVPVGVRGQAASVQVQAMSNARQLAVGAHMFAADHDEHFPEAWSQVFPDYITAAEVFFSPRNPQAVGLDAVAEDDRGGFIDTHGSFVLVRPGQKLSEIERSNEAILAVQRPDEMVGGELVVIFVDGHVEMRQDLDALVDEVQGQTGLTIEEWIAEGIE